MPPGDTRGDRAGHLRPCVPMEWGTTLSHHNLMPGLAGLPWLQLPRVGAALRGQGLDTSVTRLEESGLSRIPGRPRLPRAQPGTEKSWCMH